MNYMCCSFADHSLLMDACNFYTSPVQRRISEMITKTSLTSRQVVLVGAGINDAPDAAECLVPC